MDRQPTPRAGLHPPRRGEHLEPRQEALPVARSPMPEPFLYRNPHAHWVGDGFPVHTVLSYDALGRDASPFLLLDWAGPHAFPPALTPRGVDFHPHRGFET